MRYSDGKFAVSVVDVAPKAASFTLQDNDIELVEAVSPIKAWIEAHNTDVDQPFTENEELELAALVVDEIRAKEPHKAGKASKWSLSSVIYRKQDPTGSKSYTNAVHRDLSEDAVANLKDHHNQVYYYNAWIPRSKVTSFPLGLIQPNSIDLQKEPTGFLGIENDRTGIRYSQDHQWIYFSNMNVGDLLLWHSEIVYHAAFALPDQDALRSSLDMRIYFHEGG